MRTDALPREVVKPYHSNLDMYQRFMLNNPKTSLRNRMSDLGAAEAGRTTRTVSSARGSKRHRAPNQDTHELSPEDDGEDGTAGGKSGRPPRLAPIPATKHSGPQSHRSDGWGGTSNGDMTERMDEGGFGNDPRDAAGYSELQAAFERAYEKMLRDPPPSIVDTVLSSAWKPNSKKSAQWRTHFQKAVHRVRDWDTRSPVYEKKQYYDALWDANCRRVVENPHFKTMLLRTRPDSQHLLDHRIMDEEKQKMNRKKQKGKGGGERLRIRRKKKAEAWYETLERMRPQGEEQGGGGNQGMQQGRTRMAAAREMEGEEEGERDMVSGEEELRAAEREMSEQEGQGAVRDGEGREGDGQEEEGEEEEGAVRPLEVIEEGSREGSMLVGGGDGTGGSPGGTEGREGGSRVGMRGTDAVEEIKRAWGVAEDGVNASFSSLNQVLMSEAHRPKAFRELTEQLAQLWQLLRVPEKDTLHVRTFCMGEPSATNLAHLFYQVSRWTQYHLEVVKGCDLIHRRETLLADLLDHVALAGGAPDEALTRKLADFYAFSHSAITHIASVKNLYPGSLAHGPLLQDYIPKVRKDTVHLRSQHAGAPMPQSMVGAEDGLSEESVGSLNPDASDYQQHKVKLAAELVLNSVQREAAAYVHMLSH